MHTSKIVVVALITALGASVGTFFGLRVLVGQTSGPKMVEVPALVGMAVDQARELAEAKDLRLAIFERRADQEAAGRVIKQVPLPGSSVPAATATYVVVSAGKDASSGAPTKGPVVAALPAAPAPTPAVAPVVAVVQVVVPRVRWRRLKRAKKQLEEAGLQVGRIRLMEDEDRAPGLILKQRPKAGQEVAKGATVELWLNDTE
ncbi:MAG: PASTA domain-containing protein [Deltaproteobacteria bacterium]|nr:PASTA domain-containing protein [Deltaproteobacteria bacterium]